MTHFKVNNLVAFCTLTTVCNTPSSSGTFHHPKKEAMCTKRALPCPSRLQPLASHPSVSVGLPAPKFPTNRALQHVVTGVQALLLRPSEAHAPGGLDQASLLFMAE